MTDALDRYLARPDADKRIAVALHCAMRDCCSCPAPGLDIHCDKALDGLLPLVEALEEAEWMIERMRGCENCDYCGSPAYAVPCLSCDDHYSNWRYPEST